MKTRPKIHGKQRDICDYLSRFTSGRFVSAKQISDKISGTSYGRPHASSSLLKLVAKGYLETDFRGAYRLIEFGREQKNPTPVGETDSKD